MTSPRTLRRGLSAVLAGALLLAGCSSQDPEPTPEPAADDEAPAEPVEDEEPEPLTDRTPLTGVLVESEVAAELEDRPLLIVKVENSPQARPQAGLDAADVVLEELVEGGVTRFISLFHSELPDDVGPVRSARPVDVAIGSGFGHPVFAYSGARPQVQSMLGGSPMVALEEGAPGFRRVPEWAFAEEAPDGAVTCEADAATCQEPGDALTVAMSPSARAGWTYDDEAGVYRRDQNGEPSTVTGAGRIGAANVVVLATRHYTDGCCDTNGAAYTETDVTGEDAAIVLRDGQRYEGTWRKADADAPLELLDGDGDPFPLKPGPTWILLPSSSIVAGL